MDNVTKLKSYIHDLEQKLSLARHDLTSAEQHAVTPAERLAIYLHGKFCRDNHTDGCGWGYEGAWEHERCWGGYAHKRWLSEAEEALDYLGLELESRA